MKERSLQIFAALVVALSCQIATQAIAKECFDIAKSQPSELVGRLEYRIFPGPPEFFSVKRGDFPEPAFVLQLPELICITGEKEFTDPNRLFDYVHLVPKEQTSDAMDRLIGHEVRVVLSDPMPEMTGHHHAPLVAWVSDITTTPEVAQPDEITKLDEDPTSEYGTAATVIRAFYWALEKGVGEEAVQFIVPEKRYRGAFSPPEMSDFYGNLIEPLSLQKIEMIEADTFKAQYSYVTPKGKCDGIAIIHTAKRNGENLIAGIEALNGC